MPAKNGGGRNKGDTVDAERGEGMQEEATVATEEETNEKTMEEGGGIVEKEEVDIGEMKS